MLLLKNFSILYLLGVIIFCISSAYDEISIDVGGGISFGITCTCTFPNGTIVTSEGVHHLTSNIQLVNLEKSIILNNQGQIKNFFPKQNELIQNGKRTNLRKQIMDEIQEIMALIRKIIQMIKNALSQSIKEKLRKVKNKLKNLLRDAKKATASKKRPKIKPASREDDDDIEIVTQIPKKRKKTKPKQKDMNDEVEIIKYKTESKPKSDTRFEMVSKRIMKSKKTQTVPKGKLNNVTKVKYEGIKNKSILFKTKVASTKKTKNETKSNDEGKNKTSSSYLKKMTNGTKRIELSKTAVNANFKNTTNKINNTKPIPYCKSYASSNCIVQNYKKELNSWKKVSAPKLNHLFDLSFDEPSRLFYINFFGTNCACNKN